MRYRSLMILLVVLVATAVAAAALTTAFLRSRAEMRRELERQAMVLAITAATEVDPELNTRAYALRASTGAAYASPEYHTVEQTLRRLRNMWRQAGLDVRFIYTMVPDPNSPSGLAYAVDAEELHNQKSPPGEAWAPTQAEVTTVDHTQPQAFCYTDRYGTFFSGFAPVLDAQGNTILVVGVDLGGNIVNEASLRMLLTSLGPVGVLVVLAVLAAGLLGERLVRPLHDLRLFAERVGHGDLTARPDVSALAEAGEIARAMDNTLASLRATVRNADATSLRVREVCERLLHSRQERRTAMHLVAERTTDVARRARGVSEQAADVAANAEAAGAAARQAIDVGAKMLNDISLMDTAMQSVIQRGHELAEGVAAMRERATTVDAALDALVQVANRSSVLSLNAEIEANQAGEAGRGFAVVAREIRRLAEQAAASSLQIERNVAGIHQVLNAGGRATQEFSATTAQAGEQAARISTGLIESIRQLEGLAPRLNDVRDRSMQFQVEGQAMSTGLAEAEGAVLELRTFAESFEATLEELRDRSAEVHRLLSQLKTEA